PKNGRQHLYDARPDRVEIELKVGPIEVHLSLAAQADDVAIQIETVHQDPRAADAERRMEFFEEGAIRRPQVEHFQQIKKDAQFLDLAFGNVDAALTFEIGQFCAMALQKQPGGRLSAELRVRPEAIVPAELLQPNAQSCQIDFIVEHRPEFDACHAADVAAEQLRFEAWQLQDLRLPFRNF